jgi:hypothetical protein
MLGLDDSPERQRQRFALYAELAAATPIVRLECDLNDQPKQIVQLIESTLTAVQPTTAIGLRA